MEKMRYDDNDYVQEQYEMLIRIHEKYETPQFILDSQLFVQWANDAAIREEPDFACECGIQLFLEDYPDERYDLEQGSGRIKIHLDEEKTLSIYETSRANDICKIYIAYISKLVDIDSMTDNELEKYVYECELGYRNPVSEILIVLRQIRNKAEMEELYHSMASPCIQILRSSDLSAAHLRLQRGIMPHRTRKLDLTEFLLTIFQSTAEMMYRDSISFCYEVSYIPLITVAEPEYILTILGQLISNAARYRLPNTQIKASARETKESVEIEIRNFGNIPADVCDKIFDANYQFNSEDLGNGLGLTVAKEYASFIGGQLLFEQTGKETIFKLILPIKHESTTDIPSWEMLPMEFRMRLCVLLSDVLNTYDEIIFFIG